MRSRSGARGWRRRSSGGGIVDQSDSSGRIGARTGPRLYLALLCLLSLVACFLPLADHLGYELSELIALAAGLFGGVPGIAAARMERDSSTRALSRALWFPPWALAIPVALILLNGVRRGMALRGDLRRLPRGGALAGGARTTGVRLPPPQRNVPGAHLRRGDRDLACALALPGRHA